jgi:hypothetical protein
MSKSIFEALFFGKINPFERDTKLTAERKELIDKIQAEKKYLTDKLSAEDCKHFDELQVLLTQATLDTEVDVYSHGFSAGVMLILEVLEMRESIIKE